MPIIDLVNELKGEMFDIADKMEISSGKWHELMADLKLNRKNKTNKQFVISEIEAVNKKLWDLYSELKPAIDFINENYELTQEIKKSTQCCHKAVRKVSMQRLK